jgi:hypothetical protein
MKDEDEAMNIAFGARGKKRLNRLFDVIGFVYPYYCFPARKQGTKRKIASTTPSTTPKPKKMEVVTHHRSRIFWRKLLYCLLLWVQRQRLLSLLKIPLSFRGNNFFLFPCFKSKEI